MLAKYAIAGFAGSALLTSVAFGQAPSVTTDSANTDKATTATTASPVDMASMKGNWRTSKLVGLSVYNDNNESLGSINDLLTDKNGDIKAVVIGVGGFLGVGEHLVAVPFDKVKFVNEPVAYTGAAGAPNAGAAKTTSRRRRPRRRALRPRPPEKANPWYPDHAVYSATKDQLKAMTQFKYSTD